MSPKKNSVWKLHFVLVVSTLLCLAEFALSQFSHSLTLLVDSYFLLYNIMTIIGTLLSSYLEQKQPTLRNTFGWARLAVLMMMISLLCLLALCFSVVVEALQTMVHASHQDAMHHTIAVMGFAGANFLVHILCVILIGGFSRHQGEFMILGQAGEEILEGKYGLLNNPKQSRVKLRSLTILWVQDFIGCVFLLVTSLAVHFSSDDVGTFIDPILSIIYVFLLLGLTARFAKEAAYILLQTLPEDVSVSQVKQNVTKKFPDIKKIHKFHLWRLAPSNFICTAHIVVPSPEIYLSIHKSLLDYMKWDLGIASVTIQPEFYDDVTSLNCSSCDDTSRCSSES